MKVEGNLITADLTPDVLAEEVKGQTPTDFGFKATDNLADEIATTWGDIKAYYQAFQRRLNRLDPNDSATSITREQWVIPILELLGYQPVYQQKAAVVDGQTYAISHRAEAGEEKPPVHIISCRGDLEKRPASGTPRLSAHALVQEYLNRTEHLWAVVTNGYRWRLLRDSSLMTRLTYVEFDLEQILNNEDYAEFCLFYRLFHRSRLPGGMEDAEECLLEYYHQEARQQGGRIRDRLRDQVEKTLVSLGTGFLQHRANQPLRNAIAQGELSEKDYYRELLLLIYRLLFLLVGESRNLLLSNGDAEKARIYREYYSIERLRAIAEHPLHRREGFQDLWEGLKVTFALFDENWRGKVLGLSPLNGDLFGSNTLSHLKTCALDNYDLRQAIRQLSLYENRKQLRRINYSALDVEELGSIYESLLDFQPRISENHGIYEFKLVPGSDRKSTGSYYTPPELVAQLIKSALEPVIEDRLQNSQFPPEQALLSLKICDPACGSGHFLLAAARRIGKELARLRTGEAQPGPEQLRKAVRDVIQNCIYGVDLNPLAVDLCKVALWIEGFCEGYPLNFLDHRIKCGNSLVGVLDLDCLQEGIPDKAYKAVTGDEKTLAQQKTRENKKQRKDLERGQLSLNFNQLEESREEYVEAFREVGNLVETTTTAYREKEQRYRNSRHNPNWWRDYTACNLWTAAFFMPLTEQNLQLLPTTAVLQRLLAGEERGLTEVIEAAEKLAEEKRFFHWELEFPEVFEEGGFDCILGNPPWERIKLQEKEFFASRSPEIAKAKNSSERKKLINKLPETNPTLAEEWEQAKHFSDAQTKFIRESGRYPLTATGDVNTYAVFAETDRKLVGNQGRAGVIVPTGIATDDTCKKFFGDLIKTQNLVSLYDFENRKAIFSEVHRSYKFSLLTTTKTQIKRVDFSFFLADPKQANNPDYVFQLSPQDIALINPNTLTCPVFRTSADAELTKKIYQRIPVLENEKQGKNPWGITFMRMFDMSNDSNLFISEEKLEEVNHSVVPLYEAKMLHQFDHRWASYEGERSREISLEEKRDPNYQVKPRYWVDKIEVENRLAEKWDKEWLLAFRRIARSTDERTALFNLMPKAAFGDSVFLILPSINNPSLASCLLACLNSLVFDFVTRQKMGGTNFSFFIMRQLPVIPPENYTQKDIDYISSRVLELVYTAWDMKPFAEDMGYDGEPFIWDDGRRAKLRAELDAYYAKLYGLTRDELRYILDPKDVYGEDFPSETFRVLKNNEIEKYGEYRTQRLVLAAFDLL
jgi:type I restriction-modification system DNA methylase subunit